MQKNILIDIINEYLIIFPEERERQTKLIEYFQHNNDKQIIDWNNFDGHIVAGGFIYAKEENKFLVLFHKDLKMYLYPGGHADSNDINPLETSKREIEEETGLIDLEQLTLKGNSLIPIDIDTHIVGYNERLNLPEHYHFDFRYLFMVNKIVDIKLDTEESANYKWISIDELNNNTNYCLITKKIEKLLKNYKK